ncbi:hypothetical protein JCM11491_002741 [Sporobolomyces phaffii]
MTRTYWCTLRDCGFHSKEAMTVKRHFMRTHLALAHLISKPILCDLCDLELPYEAHFRRHLQIHEQDTERRPVACSNGCEKAWFTKNSSAAAHLKGLCPQREGRLPGELGRDWDWENKVFVPVGGSDSSGAALLPATQERRNRLDHARRSEPSPVTHLGPAHLNRNSNLCDHCDLQIKDIQRRPFACPRACGRAWFTTSHAAENHSNDLCPQRTNPPRLPDEFGRNWDRENKVFVPVEHQDHVDHAHRSEPSPVEPGSPVSSAGMRPGVSAQRSPNSAHIDAHPFLPYNLNEPEPAALDWRAVPLNDQQANNAQTFDPFSFDTTSAASNNAQYFDPSLLHDPNFATPAPSAHLNSRGSASHAFGSSNGDGLDFNARFAPEVPTPHMGPNTTARGPSSLFHPGQRRGPVSVFRDDHQPSGDGHVQSRHQSTIPPVHCPTCYRPFSPTGIYEPSLPFFEHRALPSTSHVPDAPYFDSPRLYPRPPPPPPHPYAADNYGDVDPFVPDHWRPM